ncbi:MacB family efflux pump subunit [Paucidesulfovibrio longus]|uniref:MacB family efflux pump subunit n=1 Tax=Paucidesulfovibrio longus TaxID=889 RepID=UPI0003B5777D|nr:MacB family efflux pump subunit [Paucidesulfovibrio longus]
MNGSGKPPLIELRGVSRIYGFGSQVLRALDNVSLSVERGEFVAVMGTSGSGKSTLMNILGCLDRPSEGTYRVQGRDVAALDPDELAALRRDTFGFVFQRYNLLATATASENVEIPAIYAGLGKADRSRRAHALLASLGLGDRADHRPGELSGGQQQRVSIARALMNDAAVILADEPTGALDSKSGQEVLALLKELHAQGRTIILITHDASVAEHAERTVAISDGRILSDERRGGTGADDAGRPPAPPGGSERSAMTAQSMEAVKMAWRSLRANIFRTALTLLGVVIGVGAVVAMLAVGNGSKESVMKRIESMGTRLMIVMPGAPGMRPSGEIVTLTTGDAEAVRDVDNVESVTPERSSQQTVRYRNIDYQTSLNGVWPSFLDIKEWSLAEGTFFTGEDLKGYAPVVVLGNTVKKNLFPGGESPIGKYVLLKNVPFEVIGVLAEQGANAMGSDQDDVVLLPITTGFMRLFGQHYVGHLMIKVKDKDRIAETQEAVRSLLLKRHRTEDFQLRNTASLMAMAEATQNTLTMLLGTVAAISLLVGGIGVMNIMLVSVTERTREIGIRMATGARMRDIMLQFNTEALVVCGAGGIIGVGLGFATALVAKLMGANVAFSTAPAVLAFLCSVGTGLLFGYLPARKAARLDPVAALSSE